MNINTNIYSKSTLTSNSILICSLFNPCQYWKQHISVVGINIIVYIWDGQVTLSWNQIHHLYYSSHSIHWVGTVQPSLRQRLLSFAVWAGPVSSLCSGSMMDRARSCQGPDGGWCLSQRPNVLVFPIPIIALFFLSGKTFINLPPVKS